MGARDGRDVPLALRREGGAQRPPGPGSDKLISLADEDPVGGRSHRWGAAGCPASHGGWWRQSRAGDGGRGRDRRGEDVPLVLAQRVGHTGLLNETVSQRVPTIIRKFKYAAPYVW